MVHVREEKEFLKFFSLFYSYPSIRKRDWNVEIVHMSFKEIDAGESVSSRDNDSDRIRLEYGSFNEYINDDEMYWND